MVLLATTERYESAKSKVIEVLKKEKRCSISKLAYLSGCNYYYLQKILETMVKNKEVAEEKSGNRKYYSIKG
jgi:predicted transcriptional regulator